MGTRLGIDVGGTFTDLVYYDDETGEVLIAKEPTTPAAPEEAVMAAVTRAVPLDLVRDCPYFLHGTTVALNAILERKGATVALITSAGFRDTLEIGRGDRVDMYNLFWQRPRPLVPRHLRLPVGGRTLADGTIQLPVDARDIREALTIFEGEAVTSIAVSLLHSYANPEQELAVERALREAGFTGAISLSHRISGEYREYERTCTTVIDAYIRTLMSEYLKRLEARLREAGFGGECLITRSGGGAMSFAEAEDRAFEAIQSGPVAGAEGAAEIARTLNLQYAITADVGGTSFDTCLITNGQPHLLYQGTIADMPLQSAWVDVRSIGAGGGSIAYVDAGGLLRVGPQSAGAVPGPACYGLGGTAPTVTDAALTLGMLADGVLAGGQRLDRDKAVAALTPLARAVQLTVDRVAQGILTIVAASMAGAIREITVERGQDPRQAALVAFGGSGPLFGTLLARDLDVDLVVVPPFAGNFSAWGLLGADLTHSLAQTQIMRLDDGGIRAANATLDSLFTQLASRSKTRPQGISAELLVALDMRYAGQEHSITVPVRSENGRIACDVAELRQVFVEQYEMTFASRLEADVEIVAVRGTTRRHLPRDAGVMRAAVGKPTGREQREAHAYSFTHGRWLPFAVIERTMLPEHASLSGPAIITEETTTIYLDAGFNMRVHSGGSLMVARDRGQD